MVSIIAEDVRHLHILILRHFGEGGIDFGTRNKGEAEDKLEGQIWLASS